ncbi:MAG: alanine racemase [Burkholderiaceae bacterium]
MDGREVWVELDESALRHNMRTLRRRVGSDVKIYVCIKMDAYGFGAGWVAHVAAQEGMDGLACCDASDAQRVRAAGVDLPVLLYPGTSSSALQGLAQRGFIVTAHDGSSLAACLLSHRRFYLKLDCGFGRLGFPALYPDDILAQIGDPRSCRLLGAYSHFFDQLDPVAVEAQCRRFQHCVDFLQAHFDRPLERNVGASRVLLTDLCWSLNAVNPGGLLYGLYENLAGDPLRPVLTAAKARIIAIRHMPGGSLVGYSGARYAGDRVIAIAPAGYSDGLPQSRQDAHALVRGQRVAILCPRHAEYTMLDVTPLPDVCTGDEVVFVGRQGTQSLSLEQVAACSEISSTDLLQRLARHPNRRVSSASSHPTLEP